MVDGVRYISLDETDSTNAYARSLPEGDCSSDCLTVVTADSQTAGRGQKGNSWESEPKKNLTFSVVCRPEFLLASEQFVLSQAMAISIREVLSDYFDDVKVKWPNDIYWKDKKISGTLIECDLKGKSISRCVIGTGLNVNQDLFLSDAPNPVSMTQVTGREYDKEEVLDKVLARFLHYYSMLQNGKYDEIRGVYMDSLYRCEGLFPYADAEGEFYAEIFALSHSGRLSLRREDGMIKDYEFKEVRFII